LRQKILKPFYEIEQIRSSKNGAVLLKTIFGIRSYAIGDFFLSGPYVENYFKKLLKRVPKNHKIKKALVLGLGAGGVVKKILNRFPNASITAVDYDPAMIEQANKYLAKKYLNRLQILLGDAKDLVAKIPIKFDLIAVDLFNGKIISPVTSSFAFIKNVAAKLEKDGYLLVNFFDKKEATAKAFDKYFSRHADVGYKYNKMAIYRHFGQGNAADPLPLGFMEKSSEIHLKTGPFWIEKYISDYEPKIKNFSHPRIIIWQPFSNKNQKGWRRNLLSPAEQKGIATLAPKYWQKWSAHAQRHRQKWLNDKNYEIIEAALNDFERAYHHSKMLNKNHRSRFMGELKGHLKRRDEVHFFAVREKNNNEIIAGLAVVNYPDISQSIHMVSFINPEFKNTSAGVGLIDYWHQQALKNKIKFLNFGLVWKKGDPKGWKGYSKFKKQFNLYLIRYPRQFFKFVRRRTIVVEKRNK